MAEIKVGDWIDVDTGLGIPCTDENRSLWTVSWGCATFTLTPGSGPPPSRLTRLRWRLESRWWRVANTLSTVRWRLRNAWSALKGEPW